MNIKVSIVGATGYAGAELLKILLSHPNAEIAAISSVSFTGQKISDVYPSYRNICDMVCCDEDEAVEKGDVIFAALPHGLSQELAKKCVDKGKCFIDLGADFRLDSEEEYKEWYNGEFKYKEIHDEAVYGLPEFFRDKIRGKRVVANPGCYTTAVPLALAPAVAAGIIDMNSVIADCKSGVTGSGRKPTPTSHFPELNEGFAPYKVAAHRHTPEIEQTLSALSGEDVKITFVPHLLPINRGIIATCYASLTKDIDFDEIYEIYDKYYSGEKFVRLLPKGSTANLKYVKHTNYCDVSVHLDKRTGRLVAVSCIDNMVKGAAGQAVQNMNIIFGLPEDTGLGMIPPAF